LLVVLGSLAARRFGTERLSQSLRSVMLDSPFWDEERAKDRARSLLTFAQGRKLVLPGDAEQRLKQLGSAALQRLLDLALTEPEAATQALLTAVGQENH
jgi:hypothetical protein